METTERGRYRSMEMDELEKWKDSPIWDDESSVNRYAYPLRIRSGIATREGLHLAEGNPPDETYRLGQFVCTTSPQSHISCFKHAIDFLVPDGTPVVAAYDGTVIEVQQHSDSWGPSPEFRDLLNYLTIQHENGEYTQYCHLARRSVTESRVLIGSQVRRGQQIAIVGKTGFTDRDHLHFIVIKSMKEGPFGFKSLKPRFRKTWILW